MQQNFPYDLIMWDLLPQRKKYESRKAFNTLGILHVHESFSTAPRLKLHDALVKWTTRDSAEFSGTRPIVSGTRPIVAGNSLEITGCIDLVELGWIPRHSANYSRQDTSLDNFTCQALGGLLTRFDTRGTMPTRLREKEMGVYHESAHLTRRLGPRLDKLLQLLLCNW
jgi:hypothetical protein